MTSMKGMTLDPGLEELLRAVATDPDSTLLRVPRPERLRGLFERADPGRISSVGRTVAERALLDTHRAELAWLLGEAAMTRLIAGEGDMRFMTHFEPSGRERHPLNSTELADRLQRLPREFELEPSGRALAILDTCVSEPGQERPTPRALASLAFSCQPTSRARAIHAYSLAVDGECDGAILGAGYVLDAAPSSEIAASAWELVCVARARQGRLGEAHAAQIRGLRTGTRSPAGLMNRLVMAIQINATRDLDAASRALDEVMEEQDPCLADYYSMTVKRRRAGSWRPTSEAQAVLHSTWARDRIGASRRILDVFR